MKLGGAWGWLCMSFVFSIWVSTAHAADATLAEALFSQGRELMEQGRFAEACEKFRSSYEAEPAVGTQLNLADCLERQGKTASAWSAYAAAAAYARDAGQEERRQVAEAKVRELEALLQRVIVHVPTNHGYKKLALKIDDTVLPEAAMNVALPLDPGAHTLVASASGYQSQTVEFVIDKPLTELELPRLVQSKDGAESESNRTGHGSKWAGWTLVGVGSASTAVGIASLIIGLSAENRLSDDCVDGLCPPSSKKDIQQAETFQTVALASFIVGGVALASGITVLALPKKTDEPGANHAQLKLVPQGLSFQGVF